MTWLRDEVAPDLAKDTRIRRTASGLFPSLTGISTEVQLRAIQRENYDTTMDIEEYQPVIEDFVPVASIEIDTTEQDLVFQADEAELKIMIDHLRAALMDLQTIKRKP